MLPPADPDIEAVLDAAALAATTAEILATAATIAAAESEGLTGVLRKGESIKVGESTSDSSIDADVAAASRVVAGVSMDVSGTVVAVSSLTVVAGDSTVVVGKSTVVVACIDVKVGIKVVVLLTVLCVVDAIFNLVKYMAEQPLSLIRQSSEG